MKTILKEATINQIQYEIYCSTDAGIKTYVRKYQALTQKKLPKTDLESTNGNEYIESVKKKTYLNSTTSREI